MAEAMKGGPMQRDQLPFLFNAWDITLNQRASSSAYTQSYVSPVDDVNESDTLGSNDL
jgi:hypothetical protein